MAERSDSDVNKLITVRDASTNDNQESSTEQQVPREYIEWVNTCNSVSILAAGKTGVGKSTLLNAITGTTFFKSSSERREAGTKTITPYQFEKFGVRVTAWDSPGFQDDSGKEEIYKQELRENCSHVDLLLYCTPMKETRDDQKNRGSALKQITEALTTDIWTRSIVVLTYANKVEDRLKLERVPDLEQAFNEKIHQWKVKVQKALREAEVDESVIENLCVIPAGHFRRPHLPGHLYWLSKLWIACADKSCKDAKMALIKLNQDRIKKEDEIRPGDFKKDIHKQPIVISSDAIVASGAIAGIAIGGTAGALIGALVVGVPTLGIGLGAGLALGFAVGGAIGVSAGGIVSAGVKKYQEKKKQDQVHRSTQIQEESVD